MPLTADIARLRPPYLIASTIPDSVAESADQRHVLGSAGRCHFEVGTREHQVTNSSSGYTSNNTTTVEGTDNTAYPSAYSRESVPPCERHWTRQRVEDWLNAPSEKCQVILDGFRECTSGYAAFQHLPLI